MDPDLLPFPKRKPTTDVEVELDDDDLVAVESSPSVPGLATAPRKETLRRSSPPRLTRDEALEGDVADEVLESIGRECERVSTRSITPSTLPSPPARRSTIPPPSSGAFSISRLPAVSPPPFVRTTTVPYVRDSVPSVFARGSSPAVEEPVTEVNPRSSTQMPVTSPFPRASSVAPVALSRPPSPEPTVILVRERPRTAWIVASAAIGAVVAFAATRVLSFGDAQTATAAPAPIVTSITTTLPAEITLPPAAVVAPPAPAPAPTPTAAVVKFGDDQGVAIPATPAPVAVPIAKPKLKPAPKPSAGPTLPDGSYGLGARAEAPKVPTTVPAAAPEPSPAPKKPLTPEQQLAEAQLKASIR